ncbi:hypothetical protein CTI12_AA545980 [Artemisia annua]|uniref:Uncharacterized protein n=1 Tax=Artemisia annua TaxID=35608 RepID=A0A2U1KZZ1_ARTAN|nr:hypothetical protein CTI12_AA545980 [Artemisia annua]
MDAETMPTGLLSVLCMPVVRSHVFRGFIMDVGQYVAGYGAHGHLSHQPRQSATFSATSIQVPEGTHVSADPIACAGIIRHETFAELEGVEFAADAVRRVGVKLPSSSGGTVVGGRVSGKRMRRAADISLDERPSQRPRVRPRNTASQRAVSQTTGTTVGNSSVIPDHQPYASPHVFQAPNMHTFATAPDAATCSYASGQHNRASQRSSAALHRTGAPNEYIKFGPCNCICSKCHALFWYEERLTSSTRHSGPLYHRCCLGGKGAVRVQSLRPDLPSHWQVLSTLRRAATVFAVVHLRHAQRSC